jgi:hypothetical protein|tara:strand:- start:331 stop:981 length:651 start_codon:yes stop_codon:yes gene_type:complete
MNTSHKFKKRFGNRLIELDFDCTGYQKKINTFFDERIENKFEDNTGGQQTYHIDYGDTSQMKEWIWLANMFAGFLKDTNCMLDLNEFKHLLKFTFIRMPPHGDLPPHTASFIRAMSSINIPLRGRTRIDLYEDNPNDPQTHGQSLACHHYTSPILLNVNQFHGVRNNIDEERMILKIHLGAVSMEKLIESFQTSQVIKIFDHEMPWSNTRGSKQRI